MGHPSPVYRLSANNIKQIKSVCGVRGDNKIHRSVVNNLWTLILQTLLQLSCLFQEAYRRWVCSSLVPHHRNVSQRVRPCLSVCQDVEQQCPYMLPGDRAPATPTQYAGEPTFLCLGTIISRFCLRSDWHWISFFTTGVDCVQATSVINKLLKRAIIFRFKISLSSFICSWIIYH